MAVRGWSLSVVWEGCREEGVSIALAIASGDVTGTLTNVVRITFPQVLQRHVACPPLDVPIAATDADVGTLRAVLEAAFAVYPTVRGYLLDDTGALRKHITVFVDGAVALDRTGLADRVRPDSRIDVLQALSGG